MEENSKPISIRVSLTEQDNRLLNIMLTFDGKALSNPEKADFIKNMIAAHYKEHYAKKLADVAN